jgi:hypothetical protein
MAGPRTRLVWSLSPSDAAESQLGGTGSAPTFRTCRSSRCAESVGGTSISLDASMSLTGKIGLIELREAERERAGSAD